MSASTPSDRLYSLLDAHLCTENADPRAVASWVCVGAEAIRNEGVREVYRQAMERVRDELETRLQDWLIEEGRVTDNASQGAAALLSLIEGAYQLGVTAPDLLPPGFAAPMARMMARSWVADEEQLEPS